MKFIYKFFIQSIFLPYLEAVIGLTLRLGEKFTKMNMHALWVCILFDVHCCHL